jgi:prevent-host-death family protein
MNWQLHEATNRLSELAKEARMSGPQVVTVHGKEAAVLMSVEAANSGGGRKVWPIS